MVTHPFCNHVSLRLSLLFATLATDSPKTVNVSVTTTPVECRSVAMKVVHVHGGTMNFDQRFALTLLFDVNGGDTDAVFRSSKST